MDIFGNGLYWSPKEDSGSGDGDGEGEENGQQQENQEGEVLEWDAFHSSLPEAAQNLIKEHVSGLKSSLATERDDRKAAEKDLRDVAAELEKGSEAQKKVLALADDVAASTKKANFYEDAHKAGVTNLKLAYHVAETDDLFDRRGNGNLDKLKADYPELFAAKKIPSGDLGEGTGGRIPGSGKVTMNDLIRKKAGR